MVSFRQFRRRPNWRSIKEAKQPWISSRSE
jgi:hypothetical protein